jgi:DHA1 family inner membrane transport protein
MGLRPRAPLAVLAAALGVSIVFAATPFLIPEVAERFGTSEGIAAGVSVVQVSAFAVATFMAPRLLQASSVLMRRAVGGVMVANVLSALAGEFWVLLLTRGIAGGAAGLVTWLVWADAMRHPAHMAGVASAGPIAGLLGAPLVAAVAAAGDRAVFLLLAAVLVPGIVVRTPAWRGETARREVSRSRSNRVLLVALMLLTLGSAALYVFEAVAARDLLDLTPLEASVGFSLNAAAGIVGARFSSRHRRPGWYLASAGLAAFATVAGGHPLWFYAGMAWWGFAFWMGVPGVMLMLSVRSLEPGERAGDAQAMMAAGRACAPLLGGGFVDAGAYTSLGAVAGAAIVLSGVTVMSVQEGRERLAPTDPRVA